MSSDVEDHRPITLLICALGGEGGGVLAEWLVDTAARCGFSAQSTSIPGVAQRNGSTTYYVEVFPLPDTQLNGRKPLFSLFPVPGALDALVSSELLETVRQIGTGMASPERTLVITSRHRTLTTSEKMQLGDGRAPTEELLQLVQRYSRSARVFDMAAVAQRAGTVPSAVLYGAIAGSEILPFPRVAFEDTIRHSGKAVEASLRGFAQAWDLVRGAAEPHTPASALRAPAVSVPEEIASHFPTSTHALISAGYARLLEYQDGGYARLYLERLQRILEAERSVDPAGAGGWAVTGGTARYLALWMAYDDIVRVAHLKCRGSRFARVRAEVKAAPEELVRIYDHFKPGVPEVATLLPERWARALLNWDRRRQQSGKAPLALPMKVSAHSVSGFLALRLLATLKPLRRRGSRFAQEQAMIERWLTGVERGLRENWELGHEIALCGRLIKGYGSTNERGKHNLLHVLEHLAGDNSSVDLHKRAEAIRSARSAALADDAGKALDQALVRHGAPARPVQVQPIRWVRSKRGAPAAQTRQ